MIDHMADIESFMSVTKKCCICGKPPIILLNDQGKGLCSTACSAVLLSRAKRNVRVARDSGLIDPEEYYRTMRLLNLA